MKYEITKTYRFAAAHSLAHLPPTHKCHHLHGHNYEIKIGVTGPIRSEWVQDFGDISAVVKPIIKELDHKNLDEVLPCITTAENIAAWLWKKLESDLPGLCRVEVKETPDSNVILTL